MEAICFGLHPRIGEHSILQQIQGLPGIIRLLAQFLLQPPARMEDKFYTMMAGSDVLLSPSLKAVSGKRGAVRESRCSMAAAGIKSVDAGLSRWTVECSGHSWAVGIVADGKWAELSGENWSHDWPFVGGGFGHGIGLVKRRSVVFLSARTYGGAVIDQDLSSSIKKDATRFGIVLDMDRARVFFEVDGKKIAGSSFEHIDTLDQYRLVASLPEPESSVMLS